MSGGGEPVEVGPLAGDDVAAAEALLDAAVAGRYQVRLGERHDVLALPAFGAWAGGKLVGVVSWTAERPRAELAVLVVAEAHRGRGIGGMLVEQVAATARERGVDGLWLVTTNDNLDALRLYQRHGFRLAQLLAGAVDEARAAKPEVPEVGAYGIPLHDELVLSRPLG